MFYLSEKLLHFVDDEGGIPPLRSGKILASLKEAESIARRMLGCTIEVRGKRFILSQLELYYGGAGDIASDWYRWRFPHLTKRKVSKTHSRIQSEEGLRIYLNQNGGGNYKRMDLVIGPKDVAISLLLRGVLDESAKPLCGRMGSPNKLINIMGIRDEDHGKAFGLTGKGELRFYDTHDRFVKDEALQIKVSKRVVGGKALGFDDEHFGQELWNFSLTL